MLASCLPALATPLAVEDLAAKKLAAETPMPPGEAVSLADLPGFAVDDHRAAFAAFRGSCIGPKGGGPVIPDKRPPPPALKAACLAAEALGAAPSAASARAFFETRFRPRRVSTDAFFTGYYEPVIEGSLTRTTTFATPLYPLPARLPSPPPDRAAIETGALGELRPLVYVRDPVEGFFAQVQGSARILLPDGSLRRLVYAGRNGLPYTAIGKALVQMLQIPPDQMGMSQLKAWIRANGQGTDDAGTALMRRNRSYIFFRFDDSLPAGAGPIGGEGLSLTPLRSLAVDRAIWPYGLPFYLDATIPWKSEVATPFQRLVVAQDTGAAIVGKARGDIFFGTGPDAARLAGPIRHPGTLYVLWPRAAAR